jgi:hypothetical protein
MTQVTAAAASQNRYKVAKLWLEVHLD